jgi:hypothetical protein
MTTIAQVAALFVTVAGLLAAVLAVVRTRQIPLSLAILLDFFTAASLVRLIGPLTWSRLATVALTITVRQLASHGLRAIQVGQLRLIPLRWHITTHSQARRS